MKIFCQKLFFFILPFFLFFISIIILYVIYDPFKINKDYANYSYKEGDLITSRDYISTQTYLENYKKNQYNSFIFGSSRTLAFQPSEYKKYLNENGHVFSFDASSENIYGIYSKLRLINSLNQKIDNAIIILCHDVTFRPLSENHLVKKHPILTNESMCDFQKSYFKEFLNIGLLYNFFKYKITENYSESMKKYLNRDTVLYDEITNETFLFSKEKELKTDSISYYKKRENIFIHYNEEETIDEKEKITEEYLGYLKKIKHILDENQTNYTIIISPLYKKIKFNGQDKAKIEHVFDKEKIFDYSGKNWITKYRGNYYENSHFKPFIGKSIMKEIHNDNISK